MEEFADLLKSLRREKGLTQKALAKILGVSKGTISAYENSMRTPSHVVIIRMALYLKVSTDYLYGIENREMIDITGVSEDMRDVISRLIDISKKQLTP